MWRCHLVLCTDLLVNDDLVDIVELIPVPVRSIHIPVQRLDLQTTQNGHVERFSDDKRLLVEGMTTVPIRLVGKKSAAKAVAP